MAFGMHRMVAVLLGAVAAGTACSGTGGTLFGTGGAGTSQSASSGSGSTMASTTAGSGGGTTPGSSSSSTGAPSGSSSSTGTSSSSATASSSSSAASSSSSSGALPPVSCAGAPCQAGEVCCFANGTGYCGQAGHCNGGFAELGCSSQADCPGQVCCATYAYTSQTTIIYGSVKCAATCGTMAGNLQMLVCTGTPDLCPGQCEASQNLGSGYDVCAPQGLCCP